MGLKMVKFVSCRRNIGFPLLKSISREFAARVKIWWAAVKFAVKQPPHTLSHPARHPPHQTWWCNEPRQQFILLEPVLPVRLGRIPTRKMIYYQDLDTETEIWVVYQLFSLKMTSDAKKFCRSRRVHPKKLQFFKEKLSILRVWNDNPKSYSTRTRVTVATGGWGIVASQTAVSPNHPIELRLETTFENVWIQYLFLKIVKNRGV
jgi:hypothetical protein